MAFPLRIVDSRVFIDVSEHGEPENLREVGLVASGAGEVSWDFVRDAEPPAPPA